VLCLYLAFAVKASGGQLSESWILIPARGGSKGIPYKNTLRLSGKPLILHTLEASLRVVSSDHVVVSTEDSLIAAVVEGRCKIHMRADNLAQDQTTLDEVAVDVAEWLLEQGASPSDALLTIQPTSPFITQATIEQALALLEAGAGCAVSVADDTHLRWTIAEDGGPKPLFTRRVNRQWLPRTLAETGGLIGSHLGDILASGTRINEPVRLIELDPVAGLDIDSPSDWALAQFYGGRRKIVLRADGGLALGMGHLYRALALYASLFKHERRVVSRCDGEYATGARFLSEQLGDFERIESEEEFHRFLTAYKPDIVTLDVLDTTPEFTLKVREDTGFLVCFEDLGPGTIHADLVVNDLYYDPYPSSTHWYGIEHSILSPQFEALGPAPEPREQVREVLVTFGGSDPGRLTQKALAALAASSHEFDVTVVLGPACADEQIDLGRYGLHGRTFRAVGSMAALMHRADLAITSAGRTVTELITQGIPTIAVCQNVRELRHTHASSSHGVINLGLGEHVSVQDLKGHIDLLIEDHDLRVTMSRRMRQAAQSRSNEDITQRIIEAAARKSD
jgi:spore coat polysaccharide biosynthesis predicted glycosyltransferase SpsG/CMP-N-acetylneuraminic acid synthetase